jgi:hypothetical protein
MPKKRIMCERHDRKEGQQKRHCMKKNAAGGRQVIETLKKELR